MIAAEDDIFDNGKTTKITNSSKQNIMLSSRIPLATKTKSHSSSGVTSWGISFEHLLSEPAALATFAEFLKQEYSAENIYFWTACERYRLIEEQTMRTVQAKLIYKKHLAIGSLEPVNVDSKARSLSEEILQQANNCIFVPAQKQIFNLMKFDSYQRFIRSDLYKKCLEAELKGQTLPYSADSLDNLLKINATQNASPKLKKSASNAEDRRRSKSLLPWHRKMRSKSRDRIEELQEDKLRQNITNERSSLNSLLLTNSKIVGIMPGAFLSGSQKTSVQEQRQYQESLTVGCSLCRVKFPDGATTMVQTKASETVQQLVERLLEKRGLIYQNYDVAVSGQSKLVDLQLPTANLAGKELEIEQRVTFKLDLPDPKVITVKSRPKKYLYEVVTPILHKYDYCMENVTVLRRDTQELVDLSQLVTEADGIRMQVVYSASSSINIQEDYQNDIIIKGQLIKTASTISIPQQIAATLSREAASFRQARKGSEFLKRNSNNLDELTNNIFTNIIKNKKSSGQVALDQKSLESDPGDSESSSVFEHKSSTSLNDSFEITKMRLKPKTSSTSSQHSKNTTSFNKTPLIKDNNKPIIAKLRDGGGVKLQVTEIVGEKSEDLKSVICVRRTNSHRLEESTKSSENNTEFQDLLRNKENEAATNLRQLRANLSPIDRRIFPIHTILSIPVTEKRPLPSLALSSTLGKSDHDSSKLSLPHTSKLSNTSYASKDSSSNKGPPPLPPKPKVLPIKPSNWGINIIQADQSNLSPI